MKHIITAFILFALVIGFGGIHPEDAISGREMAIHANVINYGINNLDDLSISAYIPELGLYSQSSTFDLDKNEKRGSFLFFDIPQQSIEPDWYPVRMTISNDEYRSTKYVWVYFN